MKTLTAATGLAMLTLATIAAPGWARPAAIPAALCLGLSLLPRAWPPATTLAAATAVALTTTGTAAPARTAAQGLLTLAYLVFADHTSAPAGSMRHRWPALTAAAATTALVAAALLLPSAPTVYLVLTGAAATVAAYALATPPRPRHPRSLDR